MAPWSKWDWWAQTSVSARRIQQTNCVAQAEPPRVQTCGLQAKLCQQHQVIVRRTVLLSISTERQQNSGRSGSASVGCARSFVWDGTVCVQVRNPAFFDDAMEEPQRHSSSQSIKSTINQTCSRTHKQTCWMHSSSSSSCSCRIWATCRSCVAFQANDAVKSTACATAHSQVGGPRRSG